MRYCFIFLLGLLLLSGCAVKSGCNKEQNLANIKNLRVGMTKEQVLKLMGSPVMDGAFGKPDNWYYFIETKWYDNLVTEDECAVLVFENGILKGWGNKYYSKLRLEKSEEATKKINK